MENATHTDEDPPQFQPAKAANDPAPSQEIEKAKAPRRKVSESYESSNHRIIVSAS